MAEKKPQKLKARLPRGLNDRGPAEIAATRAMIEKIRAVYERYGFEPVETPAIEYPDALGKFLPDQDRPNEGVFSFQDDDEQWLSLRYDLTAPLARYVAENFQNLALPYRSYREGYVFRNEKPRALPPVHAVRRRHGGLGFAGRRRGDVHDGGGCHGGAGHQARRLCGEGE
jgi:histidyl-tRNA synthetase